ncbi:MAG: GTPase ObgE [Anaerolineaceae bacterium]|jgi:GTP-binding protein|nr:GTPase ObgE [Anaerolineaceae bacterium]
MFIDEIEIYVRSGKGGDGAVHFLREKYVPRGGPDGGDGGRGGDIVFQVVTTLNTLSKFHRKENFIADDGRNGMKKNMTGRSAEPLVIQVPPGTVIYNADTNQILGDMVEPDQRLVVLRGGRGGRGNQHFASSRNQAPRTGERGEPGQEMNLRLELKLIADIALVGVPNAGKSSFLASVTNARPKIAGYPFTTIEPNLGVAELDINNTLVLADIPGLIEGAHQGVGLGDAFLRHIQRTRVLIHLLDGHSEDPVLDFMQINAEMALFDSELGEKPQIVAFNKMDMPDVQEKWPQVRDAIEAKGYEIMAISALTHDNVRPLLYRAAELLKFAPAPETLTSELPVYSPGEDPRDFRIKPVEAGFRVTGAAIERAAAMTYWEYDGSVRRFQRLLSVLGIEKELEDLGVAAGDTVYIGEYELVWQD